VIIAVYKCIKCDHMLNIKLDEKTEKLYEDHSVCEMCQSAIKFVKTYDSRVLKEFVFDEDEPRI